MERPSSWLNPEQFELFCKSLHVVYWNNTSPRFPAISCKDFEMLARIQYGCALRISEALSLEVDDFDLETRILTLHHTKTGWAKHKLCKGEGCEKCSWEGKTRHDQHTTIPPIEGLQRWLSYKSGKVFPIHRNTALNYYKRAVRDAKLNMIIPQQKKLIKDGSTHMLRRSYSLLMKQNGADHDLRRVKLRHKGDPLTHYDVDILTVREFENE